jgi:hypothetical protein
MFRKAKKRTGKASGNMRLGSEHLLLEAFPKQTDPPLRV